MRIPWWLAAAGMVVIFLVLGGMVLFSGKTDSVSCGERFPRPTIVAFGDSLVSGEGATGGGDFVSLLSRAAGVAIENHGVSGDATGDAKLRIASVLQREPDIALVLLGGNDALRNVPLEKTRENLTSIIRDFKKSGAQIVLLGVRGGFPFDSYKDMFNDIAREEGVLFVPDILQGVIGNRELMSDGVHPNNEGYKKIRDRILPRLLEACGRLES